MQQAEDPFHLERFVEAQRDTVDQAFAELRAGRKETHWMWFVFPQLIGLGRSALAQRYGLSGREEALAYWQHPVLGPRLVTACGILLSLEGRSAREILGTPDEDKLRSCVTLFSRIPGASPVFAAVLARYFDHQPDPRTLSLLGG